MRKNLNRTDVAGEGVAKFSKNLNFINFQQSLIMIEKMAYAMAIRYPETKLENNKIRLPSYMFLYPAPQEQHHTPGHNNGKKNSGFLIIVSFQNPY